MKFKKYTLLALFAFLAVTASAQLPAHITMPRLSLRPSSVAGIKHPCISLAGSWAFQVKGYNRKSSIQVPGEWTMQGFTVNEGETAVYSKEIQVPENWKQQLVKIRFDAVNTHATIKLNGIIVGTHEGGFAPFEADLTTAVKQGKNLLQVEVQAMTVSDYMGSISQYAVHTVGGLLRDVTLFTIPRTNLEDLFVQTVFDKNFENALLKITAKIQNNGEEPVKLNYILKDKTGKIILQKMSAAGETHIPVKRPEQWNTEHPYLYNLQIHLLQANKVIETVEQKVGFRQINIRGNELLVNGKPVKLRGVNRHSVHPLSGRSIPAALEVKDAELFRDGNCNYIRTSHYPPSQAFLNACDSLGLFVESESALCWIQHHASPIWKKWNYTDTAFLPYMISQNLDKIQSEKNHPSVIIWSLGNESRWSPLWATVNEVVKKADPSRPTAFQDQVWGSFNNAGSQADIANYHYPGINGPAATDTMSRPTLFDEFAHISDYNRRELLSDPGQRTAYNDPLISMYDSIYVHKGNLGGAIWSGIDDIFHLPDGRIVGYGPWGVIDGWRRPKPEYWGMKKAFSPIRILNINKSTIPKGYIELLVDNRYDFTGLDKVLIRLTSGSNIQQLHSAVPARKKGLLRVPVSAADDKVLLTFTDPRGFIANEERIILKQPENQLKVAANGLSYSETPQAAIVVQNGITYNIARETGLITTIRKGDVVLATRGPVFCVAPASTDDGGKPNVAGETYQNDIYPLKTYPMYTLYAKSFVINKQGAGINITVEVAYNGGSTGKLNYLFTGTKFITSYEINYKNEETVPYQYGLLMQLPRAMNTLTWHSKAERTSYPESDISRTSGHAGLNAKHVRGVEDWGVIPKGDWKDDANDQGSNDFRSTKRDIYSASLHNSSGNSITAISAGTQASRSWLQDSHIQWLIADYYSRGSEPFYTRPFSDGRINIKNKVLSGKLELVIQ